MPQFFRALADRLEKNTQPLNRYEGFQGNGAVVLRDRRGTAKSEIPNVSEKANGGTLSDDPLAIYKPTGAKSVDAAEGESQLHRLTYLRRPMPPTGKSSKIARKREQHQLYIDASPKKRLPGLHRLPTSCSERFCAF